MCCVPLFCEDSQVFVDAGLEIWYRQLCRALDFGLARVGLVQFFILGGIAPAEEGNRNVNFVPQNKDFYVSINRRYRSFVRKEASLNPKKLC
jgi:hypothetical protein